jgi:peroxiredoxin
VNKKSEVVLDASTDLMKRHQAFNEKYEIPFTLLSDEKKEPLKDC